MAAPPIPKCKMSQTWSDEGIHPFWEDCRVPVPSVTINDSHGIVRNWALKGMAVTNCTGTDCCAHQILKWYAYKNSIISQISVLSEESILWHGVRLSTPALFIEYNKKQINLWKTTAALVHVTIWNGSY